LAERVARAAMAGRARMAAWVASRAPVSFPPVTARWAAAAARAVTAVGAETVPPAEMEAMAAQPMAARSSSPMAHISQSRPERSMDWPLRAAAAKAATGATGATAPPAAMAAERALAGVVLKVRMDLGSSEVRDRLPVSRVAAAEMPETRARQVKAEKAARVPMAASEAMAEWLRAVESISPQAPWILLSIPF
jgi:hypothetical protein